MNLTTSHVTADGYIARLGEHVTRHPRYGTDAWPIELIIELKPEEVRMATYLQANREKIDISLRSGVAQLGLEAAEPELRTIRIRDSRLIVETLLTDVRAEQAESVLAAIRAIIQAGIRPKLARAVFLPMEARLSSADIRENAAQLPFRHQVHADDTIHIPLNETHIYALRDDEITPELFAKVFSSRGARHAISTVREHHDHHTNGASTGKFHLVALDVTTPRHNIFLTGDVLIGGELSDIRHGQAKLLDAARTKGVRQGELLSPQTIKHTPKDTCVVAEVYSTTVSS